MLLPDIIAPDLRLLFVGYNPSIRSAELGHHFAGRNNGFWRVLHQSGLTSRRLQPSEDGLLLEWGMGLTNLVARPTRAAADLTAADYHQGRQELRQKLQNYRPRVVCYVGIGLYKIFVQSSRIRMGWQEASAVPGVWDFVAPSTSGLNRMLYQDQLAVYRQLADELSQKLKK